jgi:cyclophilin family peptidyl-prolyl cis-trans isomerase
MVCRVGVMIACLMMWSSISMAEKLLLTIESAEGKTRGVITIVLQSTQAPNHVARIKQLVEEGLYNGVAFHRVIKGFMAQTGAVEFGNIKNFQGDKAGTGSSSYDDLKAEFSEIPFTPGVVGMARSRYIHSANSQFFIMAETQSGLNGQYTVIGMVSEGLDIVRSIKNGSKAQNGKVSRPDIIKTAVIVQ